MKTTEAPEAGLFYPPDGISLRCLVWAIGLSLPIWALILFLISLLV